MSLTRAQLAENGRMGRRGYSYIVTGKQRDSTQPGKVVNTISNGCRCKIMPTAWTGRFAVSTCVGPEATQVSESTGQKFNQIH